MKLEEYRTKQNELIKEARQLHDAAASEERDLSDTEQEQFNTLMEDAESYSVKIASAEKLEVMEAKLKESQGRISAPAEIDLPKETKGRYSLTRAIRCLADHKPLDGLEGEVSQEIARQTGKSPQGFYMPHNLVGMKKFDIDTSAAAGATSTVTDPGNFIELLRNRSLVMGTLGARVLSGLDPGNVKIPRQSGGATAYWVTEGNAVTESAASLDSVTLSPKTVGGFSDITRKLLFQSAVDIESMVREDLAAVIAIEIDRAIFNGDGTGAEPEGIMNNVSVGSVSFGAADPTLAKMIEFETDVAAANADVGSLAYVTSSQGRGKLKSVDEGTDTGVRLWRNDNTINGYRAYATNQIPANLTSGSDTNLTSVIFGNWNDVLIGFWGGLDVLVDPYTLGSSGGIRIVALQETDVKLRHDASFSVGNDMNRT